jgi:hypothetical protein
MTGMQYVFLAYAIAMAALWGYALNVWAQSRRLDKFYTNSRPNEGARS